MTECGNGQPSVSCWYFREKRAALISEEDLSGQRQSRRLYSYQLGPCGYTVKAVKSIVFGDDSVGLNPSAPPQLFGIRTALGKLGNSVAGPPSIHTEEMIGGGG